jgi:hypothetical protein
MSPNPDQDRPHEAPRRAALSGVRTEHDLRVLLRQALERNTTLERALREATTYAYGSRDLADLRKLRAVLSSAGFGDPNAKRGAANGDADSAPPGRGESTTR